MRNNTKKKIAPVLVTMIVLVYVGPIVGMLLAACAGLGDAPGGVTAFLVLYAVLGGAVIAGILLALAQRLKEIDGGEEEDAKKY